MNDYKHHVSGVFSQRRQAEKALNHLSHQGLRKEQLSIFKSKPHTDQSVRILSRRKLVLQDVLVDGVLGAIVGLAMAIVWLLGLIFVDISMFHTNRWVLMVMMLGWGGSLGAVIGTIFGATKGPGNKTGWLADVFKKIMMKNDVVLLVKTETEHETQIAHSVLQTSIGEVQDANMMDKN